MYVHRLFAICHKGKWWNLPAHNERGRGKRADIHVQGWCQLARRQRTVYTENTFLLRLHSMIKSIQVIDYHLLHYHRGVPENSANSTTYMIRANSCYTRYRIRPDPHPTWPEYLANFNIRLPCPLSTKLFIPNIAFFVWNMDWGCPFYGAFFDRSLSLLPCILFGLVLYCNFCTH